MSRIAFLFFAGFVCVILVVSVIEVPRSESRSLLHSSPRNASQVSPTLRTELRSEGSGSEGSGSEGSGSEGSGSEGSGSEGSGSEGSGSEGSGSEGSGGGGSPGASGDETYRVVVRQPDGPPRIEMDGVDPQGRTGSVACSTCHAVRKANLQNVSADTLDEFHQGMVFSHGKIACYACHHPEASDELRLADGTSVAYEDVMDLCSQCHGPQATAFAHGAHGGMNGYWDLTRGPQLKNNCIDCHDPHSPAFPKMIVGFKPKDRFAGTDHGAPERQGVDIHDHD
ncbi:hypothetical protein FYK55_23435 [Roseiconus nitratireducens]|uniref:Doubled CXXCH motif domain-containing protein n=1 Tax=Roseiconus nitratireducens TaxID=2605748 RepID=A0A5M6CXD1_9BACT|nr:cytochrome c3 family protein [Roseiconus nitratireducens]KAA5539753.1 hypothetical protein FYK55_23435 [Roseiconus nitratireducens]